MKTLFATVLGIGLVALLSSTSVHAALITCPEPGFTTEPNAKVENGAGTASATLACQYVVPPDPSNVNTIANINTANFFGSNDWESNGQTQQAGGASGTWTINSVDFNTYVYGIFFKDGQDTNLVGFVFNEQYTSGVWETPFTFPPFVATNGNPPSHDVSDYTIARVQIENCPDCGINPVDVDPIPEPGSLAMMGSALMGMTGMVWWRRRKEG